MDLPAVCVAKMNIAADAIREIVPIKIGARTANALSKRASGIVMNAEKIVAKACYQK